jgi:hypothetical protein
MPPDEFADAADFMGLLTLSGRKRPTIGLTPSSADPMPPASSPYQQVVSPAG